LPSPWFSRVCCNALRRKLQYFPGNGAGPCHRGGSSPVSAKISFPRPGGFASAEKNDDRVHWDWGALRCSKKVANLAHIPTPPHHSGDKRPVFSRMREPNRRKIMKTGHLFSEFRKQRELAAFIPVFHRLLPVFFPRNLLRIAPGLALNRVPGARFQVSDQVSGVRFQVSEIRETAFAEPCRICHWIVPV
jgi:hypothetical protein